MVFTQSESSDVSVIVTPIPVDAAPTVGSAEGIVIRYVLLRKPSR